MSFDFVAKHNGESRTQRLKELKRQHIIREYHKVLAEAAHEAAQYATRLVAKQKREEKFQQDQNSKQGYNEIDKQKINYVKEKSNERRRSNEEEKMKIQARRIRFQTNTHTFYKSNKSHHGPLHRYRHGQQTHRNYINGRYNTDRNWKSASNYYLNNCKKVEKSPIPLMRGGSKPVERLCKVFGELSTNNIEGVNQSFKL